MPTIEPRPVALVTGAGKRIGAAIARRLHREGCNLALHYGQSQAEAKALAVEMNNRVPGSAATFRADLRDLTALEAMAGQVAAQWGRLNTLVNNASTFFPTPLADSTEADWDELLDSNLKGPFFLARHLAPTLAESGGTIVNLADINARYPLRGYPIYCIAKAGVAMLTKVLARELAPRVRVNAVAPGSILWPEGEAAMTEEEKEKVLAKIPLQRLGTPEEIAGLVCFLARAPGYLTGQTIAMDGGLNLNGDQG